MICSLRIFSAIFVISKPLAMESAQSLFGLCRSGEPVALRLIEKLSASYQFKALV